ncbi:MAG: potassium channel family protein [Solirubrobacterales bacterium]
MKTVTRPRDVILPGPGHYGTTLIFLVASVFMVMAFPKGSLLDAGALVIQLIALIACLRAAEAPSKLVRVIEAIAAAAVVIALVPPLWGDDLWKYVIRGGTFLLVITALPSISIGLIKQLRHDRRITIETVFGALCIYLLLIITFASAFAVASVATHDDFFVQGAWADQYGDFVYFSVTTITTLGIGDLTPATDLGRGMTGMLTLIGQVYLVTVVALIVGNLGRGPGQGNGGNLGKGKSAPAKPATGNDGSGDTKGDEGKSD